MNRIPTITMRVVRESSPAYESRTISDSDVAVDIARAFIPDDGREHFVGLYLDQKNRAIAIHEISTGTLTQSHVHPREAFRPALLLPCAAVIFAHNHPSGDPTPSRDDSQITERLVEAGRILGIRVLDHVIVGSEGSSYSFKKMGGI